MDAQIIQELISIRSLVNVIAWVFVANVVAIIVSMVINYQINIKKAQDNDFFARGNALLTKGELEQLLKACNKHLLDFPADAGVYWLKGTAHYRRKEWNEALICYRKADELQPGFSVGPSISEIEEKIANSAASPDLKVVPPVTPIHNATISKEDSTKGVDA